MTAVAGSVVIAARAGDQSAFAALVRLETPRAYRLALSIIGSPAEAEEAVQDAFLRAWRDIGSLRDADSWPAWFRRLTVRAAIDRARRRNRIREIDLEAASQAEAPHSGLGPDESLAIRQAFDCLPAEDRAILALRYYVDLEVPDVAATLGIPVGTAKSRLHRALERLRSQMRLEP
jgi:RNA polymerase sigma-70 factor (ECF subfamily)